MRWGSTDVVGLRVLLLLLDKVLAPDEVGAVLEGIQVVSLLGVVEAHLVQLSSVFS